MPKKITWEQEDVEYIYRVLRHATIKWGGRSECLRLARKKILVGRAKSSGKPIHKLMWQCADPRCKKWFRNETDLEVDHVVEIGGVTSFNGDWNEMIAKIYARPVGEKLQALCLMCHKRKTTDWTHAAMKYKRKK